MGGIMHARTVTSRARNAFESTGTRETMKHRVIPCLLLATSPCAAQIGLIAFTASGDVYAIDPPTGERTLLHRTGLDVVAAGPGPMRMAPRLYVVTPEQELIRLHPATGAIVERVHTWGLPAGARVVGLRSDSLACTIYLVALVEMANGERWLYELVQNTGQLTPLGRLNLASVTAVGGGYHGTAITIHGDLHLLDPCLGQMHYQTSLWAPGGPYNAVVHTCEIEGVAFGQGYWILTGPNPQTDWHAVHHTGYDDIIAGVSLNAATYVDCDTGTFFPVLDYFDFLCFGNRFVNGDPYACDCDTTTGPGVCDVFDFICFANAFAVSCIQP